jgi:putative transcriptional regulator
MITEPTYFEGQFLVAMPHMGDTRFENTVIFICAHNEDGAMGFIVNRPLPSPTPIEFFVKLGLITELDSPKIPEKVANSDLNTGGPVEPGRGFVLHSADYCSETTLKVNDQVSLTATLEILRDIAVGKGPTDFLMALGYSGWGAGQLEDEIAANGWLTSQHCPEIIYSRDHDGKYHQIMRSMGIDPRLISGETGHA